MEVYQTTGSMAYDQNYVVVQSKGIIPEYDLTASDFDQNVLRIIPDELLRRVVGEMINFEQSAEIFHDGVLTTCIEIPRDTLYQQTNIFGRLVLPDKFLGIATPYAARSIDKCIKTMKKEMIGHPLIKTTGLTTMHSGLHTCLQIKRNPIRRSILVGERLEQTCVDLQMFDANIFVWKLTSVADDLIILCSPSIKRPNFPKIRVDVDMLFDPSHGPTGVVKGWDKITILDTPLHLAMFCPENIFLYDAGDHLPDTPITKINICVVEKYARNLHEAKYCHMCREELYDWVYARVDSNMAREAWCVYCTHTYKLGFLLFTRIKVSTTIREILETKEMDDNRRKLCIQLLEHKIQPMLYAGNIFAFVGNKIITERARDIVSAGICSVYPHITEIVSNVFFHGCSLKFAAHYYEKNGQKSGI